VIRGKGVYRIVYYFLSFLIISYYFIPSHVDLPYRVVSYHFIACRIAWCNIFFSLLWTARPSVCPSHPHSLSISLSMNHHCSAVSVQCQCSVSISAVSVSVQCQCSVSAVQCQCSAVSVQCSVSVRASVGVNVGESVLDSIGLYCTALCWTVLSWMRIL
jgi:hypothetical protein